MIPLRIIPVLDIMNRVVVHAVRGEREKYKPLTNSAIVPSCDPIEVARTLKEKFGFNEIYIADLDCITRGSKQNFDLIEKIAKMGIKTYVDIGIRTVDDALLLFNIGVDKVIVATETLTYVGLIEEVSNTLGKEHTVLSLDIKENTILSENPQICGSEPCLIAKRLSKFVSEIIAIDLGRVGTLEGVNLKLARNLVECSREPVIFGGGIKSMDDLMRLKQIGVSGVLLASALHKGVINAVPTV